MSRTDSVNLVVPCYKESGRIGAFLPKLCAQLDALEGCHVLVVEDGSAADEQERMSNMVRDLMPQHPCLRDPLLLPKNLGKGGAVYTGWKQHQGEAWLG